MNKNIKVAKSLVKLAKELTAGGKQAAGSVKVIVDDDRALKEFIEKYTEVEKGTGENVELTIAVKGNRLDIMIEAEDADGEVHTDYLSTS